MSGGYSTGTERRTPVVTKTGNYTATLSDGVIICNMASGILTLTLPKAASAFFGTVSHRFEVKRKFGSSTVIIDGDGSETIDGSSTYSLGDGESITLISDGSAWYII